MQNWKKIHAWVQMKVPLSGHLVLIMPAQIYSQCLEKLYKISKAIVQMHMLIC